ncbi:GNAT family N-acetyltransferase [Legionella tunisiensis]|uniref:GNAT family N-acetyltransferase n=1 Tax=Legionella tunisiensis TaxID=1034944 RepID=UPI0002D4E198|nr:GNAT family N-acetyltransferase [Legionella tunisiensis]
MATPTSTVSNYGECAIYLEEANNPEITEMLSEKLKAYNESKIGKYSHLPYTIYIKSDDGSKVIGGCNGDITLTNCYVDCIWVDEEYRKHGIGLKLMNTLAAYAKNANCEVITIETADFQAKDFYEKAGFSIISITEHNCFLGHKVYLMRKTL